MRIDTNQMISMREANQNFSKAVKIVDHYDKAIVLKNNKPKYIIVDFENNNYMDLTDDERIQIIAKRVLNKYLDAFKELAKWLNLAKKMCY